MTEASMVKRSILALDQMDETQVLSNIDRHLPDIEYYKIGLEQFCKYGPDLVKRIASEYEQSGLKFFLDLKLHDIPKTVAQSIKSLQGLPLSFLTIHLSGGPEMVKAALDSANEYLPTTTILGVSLLTSLDPSSLAQTYGIDESDFDKTLKSIVTMGNSQGLKGLVCSINDLALVNEIAPELTTVCPGIRFEDQISSGDQQDQKRVATPQFALEQKANFIVIGRALTQAGDLWQSRMDQLKSL